MWLINFGQNEWSKIVSQKASEKFNFTSIFTSFTLWTIQQVESILYDSLLYLFSFYYIVSALSALTLLTWYIEKYTFSDRSCIRYVGNACFGFWFSLLTTFTSCYVLLRRCVVSLFVGGLYHVCVMRCNTVRTVCTVVSSYVYTYCTVQLLVEIFNLCCNVTSKTTWDWGIEWL